MSYPGDEWCASFQRDDINPRYAQAGRPVPLDAESAVWVGRTLWDIGDGLAANASRAKHLAELDAALAGTMPPTGPPSPGTPAAVPYPGDQWCETFQRADINPRYVAAGHAVPLDPWSAVWVGRTLWDIGAGLSPAASRSKHLAELDAALGITPPPYVPPNGGAIFAPEQGAVYREGSFFYRENGSVFDWRGCSLFLIPNRTFRGEDCSSHITWMQGHGFNVCRMFVAGVDWSEWPEKIFERADYQDRLHSIFTRFHDAGIRVEATVCTYGIDTGTWHNVLRKVYSVVDDFHFVETMNEPWAHGKGDPVAMMEGISRGSVCSSYGIAPHEDSGYMCPFDLAMPRLDYLTPHLRRDEAHMSRGAKDGMEMRDFFGMATCSDEPIGAGEVEEPGRRTCNKKMLSEHHAIARLLYGGSTFHFNAGVEGRIPGAYEPVQEDLARGVTEVFKFIPPESQTGQYARPGLGDFPVHFVEGMADHPYASILGNTSYLVMTECAEDWTPEPVNGWQVETIHHEFNWLVKLRR